MKDNVIKFKTKKDKKREITLIIITTMVLVLFFTGYSIGKGLSDTKIQASGQIAEPILVVENGKEVSITQNTNGSYYYHFKVKNYNQTGKITRYKFKI